MDTWRGLSASALLNKVNEEGTVVLSAMHKVRAPNVGWLLIPVTCIFLPPV